VIEMTRQLRDPGAERALAEQEARTALATFEADPGMPVGAGATAAGYIRAMAPAEGDREPIQVTFVPGELLPQWAADRLHAGQATYDAADRVWILGEGKGTS
jgi:hypothetical protein